MHLPQDLTSCISHSSIPKIILNPITQCFSGASLLIPAQVPTMERITLLRRFQLHRGQFRGSMWPPLTSVYYPLARTSLPTNCSALKDTRRPVQALAAGKSHTGQAQGGHPLAPPFQRGSAPLTPQKEIRERQSWLAESCGSARGAAPLSIYPSPSPRRGRGTREWGRCW